MAAANTDLFRKKKSLFSTTLSSGISAVDTTMTLASTSGLPTDTAITLTLDRVDANGNSTPSARERITGVVSASTVTNMIRGEDGDGGTGKTHSAGAVIEDIWDAESWNDAIGAIITEHNQDGSHKKVTGLDNNVAITQKNSSGTAKNVIYVDSSNILQIGDSTLSGAKLNLASIAQGDVLYVDSNSRLARLGAGTNGQFLKTQGASANPIWADVGTDGWNQYSAVTPTSGTLDDPTFPIVFAGVDLTSILSVGMKVKIAQGTTKYFIITAIAFSTDTTVTLYGGTDYDLVATGTTAISAFYYSTARAPAGFPMSPVKWTVKTTNGSNVSQASPTNTTWYNPGTVTIAIPIGVWNVNYCANIYTYDASGTGVGDVQSTLSTANNSESDGEFTCYGAIRMTTSGLTLNTQAVSKSKQLTLAAKATYYLNVRVVNITNIDNVGLDGSNGTTTIHAVCAYL